MKNKIRKELNATLVKLRRKRENYIIYKRFGIKLEK